MSWLAVPAQGKRAYYYDETIPGFGVAITHKGTKTFIYYRKIAGKPKRVTLGHFPDMTVIAARKLAGEAANAVEKSLPIETIFNKPLATEEPIAIGAIKAKPTYNTQLIYMGIGAVTAVICLVLMAILGASLIYHWKSQDTLQSVASFAIDNHLNHREVAINSSDPGEIKQILEHAIPFSVDIPRIDPGFKIIGGRAYKIGANSVAYTLWKAKNNYVYSLLQFRRADFGVGPSERPQILMPQDIVVRHTPCEVLYWSRGDYGFMLVADNGDLMQGVIPEASAGIVASARPQ